MKTLPTKHARRRFTVARDSNGVPHISAASWRAALYGLGYMHGVDRPTQLLFARAVASGQSAEQIADKPELLEMDRFFRRAGLHLSLEKEVAALDDDTFDQLTAYCEGVNDGMKDSGRSLPMWATGFVPQPWNQMSVLLLGNLLSYGGLVVGQQQNERILLDLIHAGVADDKLRELFHPLLEDADFDLLRQVKISSRLSDDALELITDLPRLAGSNAWAVSPRRSTTGSALLASDPHLEINRLPAIWYEAELHWGEEYVFGATLPGCPLFAVARTRDVSWGVTYLKGDTTDHFIEDCRTNVDGVWQYRRGEDWIDFEIRHEVIGRKGAPSEHLPIYYNELATLETSPDANEPGYYLSSSWVGDLHGAGRSIATWLDLIDAPDAAAAMDIVRECPLPTLCWVFADREGHIGMQANGWFPNRAENHNGLLPIPAWDEANHWQGMVSSRLLPRVYDPPEGVVATANEDVTPPEGPMLITQPVPEYRKRRIDERLAELPKISLADMQALQYDVVSVQARDLLQVFLPHLPEGRIKERLAAWDCSYTADSYEATLFSHLYRNVLLEVFGHEEGIGWRRMLYLCSRAGFSTMVLTAIDKLLLRDESLWWHGRDKGELVRRAAERLEGEKEQPWSVINSFQFVNRFVESRFVGRAFGFHTGDMALPGCYATPFQGHLLRAARREASFAPSYHFVTDMGTDEAWTNLPGGPSESIVSGYYKSDIPRWHAGEYKRLAVEEVDGE
ncbi:MAG: penicillin acylase family protein [Planctomycetota bacterium]|nr:MAG: penicillin acylase family protein [Planctomycetota bacterium]